MTWYRLKFYLFGLVLGIIVLAAMGKFNSCKMPGVLKREELYRQPTYYTPKAICLMDCQQLDTAMVRYIIRNGEINFSESAPREKPCGIYIMEGKTTQGHTLRLVIQDCNNKTEIMTVTKEKNSASCNCP